MRLASSIRRSLLSGIVHFIFHLIKGKLQGSSVLQLKKPKLKK